VRFRGELGAVITFSEVDEREVERIVMIDACVELWNVAVDDVDFDGVECSCRGGCSHVVGLAAKPHFSGEAG